MNNSCERFFKDNFFLNEKTPLISKVDTYEFNVVSNYYDLLYSISAQKCGTVDLSQNSDFFKLASEYYIHSNAYDKVDLCRLFEDVHVEESELYISQTSFFCEEMFIIC